ncbi:MAG TPA: xanthine dehydrogenase family protein molybdopterin-binding subunit [Nocardioidaceae bacterium]|nr:xanthine dehydrogenase family protein molybdopterin-binding subunit [Nocardioidaceae bacterium]
MTEMSPASSVGTSLQRLDGPAKVLGRAAYAFEQPLENAAYLHPLQATIARGTITRIDSTAAEATEGVIAVLTHRNASRLDDTEDRELAICQGADVAFRGELIGGVVAETQEIARHAASLVEIDYEEQPHDTRLEREDGEVYTPDSVNPTYDTDTDIGDVFAAIGEADVLVDETYKTPMEHNNPLEPHTSVAVWRPGGEGPTLTVYDSTQSVHGVRAVLARVFGLDTQVRVVSPYVGGGFGSKGRPHAHNVLAVLAAQLAGGRPVKLAVTRQQMFAVTGYRTPTISRLRLAADADGRLTALCHDAVEQTSRIKEFAEQTATCSRMMYAAPNRRTTHRLAALDVPVPSWMRAPGEAPGMYALESAVDELAHACGLDPIELRMRNEPDVDPESGKPWSGRHLVECLRTGAERFGWDARAGAGTRREGSWLVGLGVAASTYPAYTMPGSVAEIGYRDGRYAVRIGAADIGTGTWTALSQIAADALERPMEEIDLSIGDTDLPYATVEGGSSGIASWGSTVVAAARAFRDEHGKDPDQGAVTRAEMPEHPDRADYAAHSFGAVFVEARVHVDTREVRIPRMLGVFSAGRIVNPRTARSQLIGGMTFGLSMALFEESVLDHRFGHVVNHDLAQYHVPAHADIGDIEATWLDHPDEHANALGAKGIGEIGIVGTPAAVANAVHNATGIRVRDLPITPDKLLA